MIFFCREETHRDLIKHIFALLMWAILRDRGMLEVT